MPTLNRTPREWDETCRDCRGSGKVHKRERFSLWTPDEHEPYEPIVPPAHMPKNVYVCMAGAGSSIFEACKEGVEISKTVDCPVAFEFNDKWVLCLADSDPVALADEWWTRAYNKTREQSMKDR